MSTRNEFFQGSPVSQKSSDQKFQEKLTTLRELSNSGSNDGNTHSTSVLNRESNEGRARAYVPPRGVFLGGKSVQPQTLKEAKEAKESRRVQFSDTTDTKDQKKRSNLSRTRSISLTSSLLFVSPNDSGDNAEHSPNSKLKASSRIPVSMVPDGQLYKPTSMPKLHSSQGTQDLPAAASSTDDIHSQYYKMDHLSRGKVAIFFNKTFVDLEDREGGEKDVKLLKESLPLLGFRSNEIHVFPDYTADEIKKTLDQWSMDNYDASDCLIVFVLTHGESNDKLYAHDEDYTVDKIWKPFLRPQCTSLLGKPKIFVIVACRGGRADAGRKVSVMPRIRRPSTSTDAALIRPSISYTVPTHADMIIVHSTMPGHYSFRDTNAGTWFIQAFSQTIKRYKPATVINFTDFLTTVNRKIALSYTSYNADDHKLNEKKQCSSYTSTLTRQLNFTINKPSQNRFSYM